MSPDKSLALAMASISAGNNSQRDTREYYTASEPMTAFFTVGPNFLGNQSEPVNLYVIHCSAAIRFHIALTIFWYIVGFPGNIGAFIIWSRPTMRHYSGLYLAVLALTDLLFLIYHFLFELHIIWGVPILHRNGICEIFPILFLASQYMSPLLVLGFTVERYISICADPFQSDERCTTRRAIKVICCLVAVSLLLTGIQGFFWKYHADIGECDIRKDVTIGGPKSLWSVWSWVTEVVVFGLVPLATLALNMLVFREIWKITQGEGAITSTTVMCLAVSLYSIVVTLPVTVLYVLYLWFPPGAPMAENEYYTDVTWQRHFSYWRAKQVVEAIGMSHYAVNFYIYCITRRTFREKVFEVVEPALELVEMMPSTSQSNVSNSKEEDC